ncbi:cytochrome c biogenesis protein CcdC [Brevibacillus ruminantium]|uniref:Cytochrome c biogenesis protein CcdC n=1 Tax=Brevibacillus ruminantium TaxID=2950604 RepID=A0ABY4WKR8_9BACL|nr:cytochrome c biogenesis protein CcdC [Brevibacillus ruminantium]USG67638.1 cytochrome c biogenesis protein CcdC [Brevibacillus ruminantium]
MHILSSSALGMLIPLLMATAVMFLRLKAQKKPISARRIILPPLFMSTGFAMFHFPETATPFVYHLIAFFAGMVLSIPLIVTSRFEFVGQEVYLKRSRAFFLILLGVLVVRTLIKLWVNDSFTVMQTGGLFFVLAYGMILPWRLAMLYMYRQLVKKAART